MNSIIFYGWGVIANLILVGVSFKAYGTPQEGVVNLFLYVSVIGFILYVYFDREQERLKEKKREAEREDLERRALLEEEY